MQNWFLSNQQSITFLIAVIGFLISITLSLHRFFLYRKNFSLSVIDYAQKPSSEWKTHLFILIHNKSSQPLFISSIKLQCTSQGKLFWRECGLMPQLVRETAAYTAKTAAFPITVPPLGMCSEFLEFQYSGDRVLGLDIPVSFQIQTNRGMVVKSALLSSRAHYLHTRHIPPEDFR